MSPIRPQTSILGSREKERRQRRARHRPEYFGFTNGGAILYSHQTSSTPQIILDQAENQQVQSSLSVPLNPPSIPPTRQASADPSPAHSRPASISHSMAHPQAYPAGPPNQPIQWRRASSLSSPFNPYHPTPIASTTLHILMLLVHLGILIVLGILLSDLRKTTATFHTMSNNGTGSYLRVGLYGGGLGSINRPFYIGGLSNASVPIASTQDANSSNVSSVSVATTATSAITSTVQ